jgi:NADP-dependent 3-hydroxy acid dehydrogenase YdfG
MRARPLGDAPDLPGALVAEAGQVDVLLLHLALPAPSTLTGEIGDADWRRMFAHRVDPMRRLVVAVLPQRVARAGSAGER